MTWIVLDVDTTLDYMLKAVKFRGPHHVDPRAKSINGCKYAPEGDLPSCIVGHILTNAGVGLDDLEAMDEEGYYGSSFNDLMRARNDVLDDKTYVDEDADVLPEDLIVTPDAATILISAQELQDRGSEWGVIYSSAVEQAAQLASRHSDTE